MPIFGLLGGLLKQKPKVPKFTPVNAQDEQARSISGNRAAFGEASQLASEVDQYNQEQLMARMNELIPDLPGIQNNASANIADMLQGRLPDDVSAEVSRNAATGAFGRGISGSGFSGNLRLRDLGLTSLQVTQQGLDSASRWLATARTTLSSPQMDVTSMFITPAQQAEMAWKNKTAEMNMQWTKNQLDAQYDWRTQLGGGIEQLGGMATNVGANLAGLYFANRWGLLGK